MVFVVKTALPRYTAVKKKETIDSNKFRVLLKASFLINDDNSILNRTIKSCPLEIFD